MGVGVWELSTVTSPHMFPIGPMGNQRGIMGNVVWVWHRSNSVRYPSIIDYPLPD